MDKPKKPQLHISLPWEVRKAIKVHCADKGIPIGEWILKLVARELNRIGINPMPSGSK